MAKPDTDDGWFKIAVELEAALAFGGFSKIARTLLRYVFTQIYGRGSRPKLAYLPQKTIADRIGQRKQNVSRAIRELVESHVLAEAKPDHYWFIKDYEKWTTWGRDPKACGLPRLTPKEVADCKDSPRYADGFRLASNADPGDATGSSHGITRSSNGITGGNPTGLPESSNGITGGNPTGLPESSNGITGGNPTGLPESSNGITGGNPTGLPESSNGITGPKEERPRVQRDLEKEERDREFFFERGEGGQKKTEALPLRKKDGGIDWMAAAKATCENGGFV